MIAIIDYGMGNLGSILNMLKKVGAETVISSDAALIERADKLILPGVGAFDYGIKNLTEHGLIPLLNAQVIESKKPILGLCLGMQLFTRHSAEGQLPGLGWIDAETVRFQFDQANVHLKVPHMGWNSLRVCQPHPIFIDLDNEPRFYFVHSYHVVCADTRNVLAQTRYGDDFASVIGQGNITGVQFHPEKSHRFGMQLLKNFAEHS
ncbi:MAG: imidazole glycerol phosphate synthase subunit HisH [Anaerolineae bacterium]|nr:imidazole glycerol phosphate synthase subunit HisH [Anaerolineae bacterium]